MFTMIFPHDETWRRKNKQKPTDIVDQARQKFPLKLYFLLKGLMFISRRLILCENPFQQEDTKSRRKNLKHEIRRNNKNCKARQNFSG